MRSKESATSWARYDPHMAVDAARASAKETTPSRSKTNWKHGNETMASTTSQK